MAAGARASFSSSDISRESNSPILRPLVYLVSPAFRFHSTTGRMLRYLEPTIRILQVGINDGWRKEIKILFRREFESAGLICGKLR